MMKRILLSLLLLLALAPQASAQDSLSVKRQEVNLRVGIIDSPALSMGLHVLLGKTWTVGASLTFLRSNLSLDYMNDDGYYCGFCFADHDHQLFLMAEAKARWARHRKWNMYSRIALGPGLELNGGDLWGSDSPLSMGGQFSPLAVEVGNDHVRGFLELGFGMQGVLNVGLAHRF